MAVIIIDFIVWIFSIIPKIFKGINYIFLKRPTISKYVSLTLLSFIGLTVMVLKAREWGIIALIVGLSIPVTYISLFSSKLDEVRKDLESIKEIANNTNLEIVFSQEETKLFEREMLKDEAFREDVRKNFLRNHDRLRKKQKKSIEKEITREVIGSDLISTKKWKFDDNKLKGGNGND